MSTRTPRPKWLLQAALPLAAGALATLLLVLSWLRSSEPARPPSRAPQAATLPAPPAPRQTAPAPTPPAHRSAPVGAGAQPHPITPERLRIDEQHQLFDRVEAAIDARDFARARALLREHHQRFPDPDDWTDLRRGWQVVADCLQYPGPDSTARAQSFVDQERGSSLRRRVRRTCLARSE